MYLIANDDDQQAHFPASGYGLGLETRMYFAKEIAIRNKIKC